MFIIKHKKIFLGISVALVSLSILLLLIFGLKIGIDFKGGALIEVVYDGTRPDQTVLDVTIQNLDLGSVTIQPTEPEGKAGYIVKTRDLTEEEHNRVLNTLSQSGKSPLQERNFNSIGPSVGRELTRKAVVAIVLVSLTIICFIAFAFRKVSNSREGVSSWKYGLIAIITLIHDVLIPMGIFVILSRIYGVEADTLFVVAILTILGLSVSDTIVIFDRIRENLKNIPAGVKFKFSEVVGKSLEQSFARSLSTSLTVILVLLALFFFGPVSTKYFALMLATGMFFGTYSSLFLASPLLVLTEERQNK